MERREKKEEKAKVIKVYNSLLVDGKKFSPKINW